MKQIRGWRMGRKKKDPLNTYTVHKKAAVSVVICYRDKITDTDSVRKERFTWAQGFKSFSPAVVAPLFWGLQ